MTLLTNDTLDTLGCKAAKSIGIAVGRIAVGTGTWVIGAVIPKYLSQRLKRQSRNARAWCIWTQRGRGSSSLSRGRGYQTSTWGSESYPSGIGWKNGSAKSSSMPFREWKEHHTCFYDACFPCAGCTSSIGNERHRKGCAIIKNWAMRFVSYQKYSFIQVFN